MMIAEIEMKKMKLIIGWNDRFFKIIPIEWVTKKVGDELLRKHLPRMFSLIKNES